LPGVDRIATFRAFIERSPADPFPRYGLAMEYKRLGRLDEARAAFADLITRFPDYVPSYLHAGGVIAALGERDEAAALYRRGIAAATARGDAHARSELETALAEL
jgi:tetratricopeptide (TPR) repeat protein